MAADHLSTVALRPGHGLRLALVGYGRIAVRHLEVFRALGCSVEAACNRSPEGRQQAREVGGIVHTYQAIGEMLERERPDGVLCCVSYPQMAEAALEILPYGLPTLLEKPPGTSLEEFEALCRSATTNGTPVQVAVNRRHYSVLRKALEDAGGFGALTGVFVDWSEQPKSFLNRGFSRDAVERLIFANSLHALDLITHLAGAVPYPLVQVQDLGEPLRWNMALTGLSERGILVNFTSTWDSPARWRMSLTSPGRRYTLAPLETCSVLEQGSWQERIIDPDPVDSEFKPGFHRQALAFLALVRGRTSPEGPSLESLRPGMRLADALTEALLSASETETEPGDS